MGVRWDVCAGSCHSQSLEDRTAGLEPREKLGLEVERPDDRDIYREVVSANKSQTCMGGRRFGPVLFPAVSWHLEQFPPQSTLDKCAGMNSPGVLIEHKSLGNVTY